MKNSFSNSGAFLWNSLFLLSCGRRTSGLAARNSSEDLHGTYVKQARSLILGFVKLLMYFELVVFVDNLSYSFIHSLEIGNGKFPSRRPVKLLCLFGLFVTSN